jgi:hypothetical protein
MPNFGAGAFRNSVVDFGQSCKMMLLFYGFFSHCVGNMCELIACLLFVVAFVLVVARAIIKNKQRAQLLHGNRCKKCGYDLRYSKEICPECGETNPSWDPTFWDQELF